MAVVEFPRGCPEVLQEGALVREGEVETEVAAVFSEGYLPQKLGATAPMAGFLELPLFHLQAETRRFPALRSLWQELPFSAPQELWSGQRPEDR